MATADNIQVTPALTVPTDPNAGFYGSAVNQLLDFQAQAVQDQSTATGQNFTIAGYQSEEDSYNTAANIADNNATINDAAGQVKEFQQTREANQTIGSQKAEVASAGFGASGTALDLLRSSRQQSLLTTQLTGLQTEMTSGGYLAQAAASRAEANAADAAKGVALNLQQTAASTGALMQSYAGAEADALAQVTNQAAANVAAANAANQSTGPKSTFNGVDWVTTPGTTSVPITAPSTTSANTIASTVASGGLLTPSELTAAAVQASGVNTAPATQLNSIIANSGSTTGGATTRRWNGVSWV